MSVVKIEAPASVQDDNNDSINLLEYWQVLRDRRWIVLGVTAAITLLALAVTLLMTPIYRAASTLQIERDTMKIMDVEGLTPAESPMDRDFYQTQYELLHSRSLARRVVQDLHLEKAPLFAKTLASVDAELEGKQATPAVLRDARERALVEETLDDVTIEPIRNSRLVRVNFDSADPVLSAKIANAWSDAFIASNLERKFDASSYARKYLEERLAQLKGRLEDSEKALVSFATDEQIVSVGEDKPSLSAQNLSELNAQLAQAQSARIRAEAAWDQARAGDGLGMPQVVQSPLIQKLRESRSLLAAQYQEQARTFKADYPDMKRLAGQIAETDQQIATEVGHIREAVRSEFEAARAQESLLEGRLTGLKNDVLDLQGRSIRYNILRREAETNRQLYDGLLQRYKEIGVVGNVGANNVSVIDRADVPEKKHSPRLVLNLAVGLLLGLFAGVLAAFLLEHLDRRVHAPKELEDEAGVPVLGAIPRLAPNETVVAASADTRSPFSESYRSVRTALQFSTEHGLPRNLLITSAGPSEGKSTTALELARNIAQAGKRVVLVDADLRKPSIHRTTGLANAKGLSNVLSGSAQAADVLQRSLDGAFDIMTSGPLPPNPPELLAGDGMSTLLAELQARFDVIVIDGPPVLGLADAPLLANVAEATILVAAAEQTRRDSIRHAIRRLRASHAHVLGALLTRFDLQRKGDDYGYGAYTYYSYGKKAA
ncbi:polysaccharide biosynthesis tyrosine autokinase [Lysobacter sp. KIS68-7]|uniref:GumC family protein n=1 Tax=Lysobacter sp. KIS68-7 TaxID=2904252 RepID=UPI001E3777B8|nr:polysaccharide biosynthesis tyrosine autokinase [Lysobacter sp. KIS68-7]UHQ18457.1 polysaccharide biosynthesis tyrosine autokinase [Lysobacter sp. KIS68-7]